MVPSARSCGWVSSPSLAALNSVKHRVNPIIRSLGRREAQQRDGETCLWSPSAGGLWAVSRRCGAALDYCKNRADPTGSTSLRGNGILYVLQVSRCCNRVVGTASAGCLGVALRWPRRALCPMVPLLKMQVRWVPGSLWLGLDSLLYVSLYYTCCLSFTLLSLVFSEHSDAYNPIMS
ncbi:hypothetical protein F5888DRAFT_777111 [Russula emetica]|nr:hypothetical protein F5888DRAFT_777111 [Russula emetica]